MYWNTPCDMAGEHMRYLLSPSSYLAFISLCRIRVTLPANNERVYRGQVTEAE